MRRLTVVSANACNGGIDPRTGDDSGALMTIKVLRGVRPHVVLLQEMDACGDPNRLWRHLRYWANALDMEAVLGPSAAVRSELGNHTAILVAARRGLRVTDQWPPPPPAGPRVPWCHAEVTVPGLAGPLHLYSVHLSAESPSDRVHAAELIAGYTASCGQHVLAGGGWNDYPRGGPVPSAAELGALPAQARVARCRRGPTGLWEPCYDVDDLLGDVGLADIAACWSGAARLAATTGNGARADRCYATADLAAAAVSCQNLRIGSDHQAVACTFDFSRLPGDLSNPEEPPGRSEESLAAYRDGASAAGPAGAFRMRRSESPGSLTSWPGAISRPGWPGSQAES